MPLCTKLNPIVREDLQNSWERWGVLLTSYRDCVHHYVPLDFGLTTISVHDEGHGVWSASARIPDNPEARSKKNFKFQRGRDALTYGWQVAG